MVSTYEWRTVQGAWWKLFPEDDILAEKYLEDLRERYEEDHRYYHTLEHIHEALQESLVCMSRDPIDRRIVIAAILFHDVIYDPTARNAKNETASAIYATKVLSQFPFHDDFIAAVAKCILETATHQPTTPESCVVSDSDMYILANNRLRYWRYMQDVRKEFAHLSDSEYSEGRSKWIESVLTNGKPIFHTPITSAFSYENKARVNLSAELELYGVTIF